MNSVFISYRRDDSATICGRIFESLEWYFGKGAIFKDVDSIPYGVSFPQYITSVLEKCGVTLVVIGRHWLDAAGADGRRRLDDPGDFVRLEIETALARPGMVVLPLLVEGATMPPADQLPPSLRPLTQRNSAQVRNDPDYQGDMRRVQTAVQSTLLAQGQHGSWTSAGASDAADAAQYAPGRANRGLLITLGAIVLAVVIAVPVLLATGVLSSILPGGGGNSDTAKIEQTISGFCNAVHDSNYNAAYAYFSPHYKETVTSYAQVPGVLGSTGTINGCSEFGSGGFLHITGTTAQDEVEFTVATSAFGTQTVGGTVYFVKSGSDWLIDNMTG
jgi:hypothetical protein